MTFRRALFLLGRATCGLFCIFTSIYCLLAYIPFTYYHFVQYRHLSSLSVAVQIHPYLFLIVLALVGATSSGDLRQPKTRRLMLAFIVFHGLLGLGLVLHPL